MELNNISVTMYYDWYEREFGDGFYPIFPTESGKKELKSVNIRFLLKGNIWTQVSEDDIDGLDGNTGEVLIALLNEKNNDNGLQIVNSSNKILYPKLR